MFAGKAMLFRLGIDNKKRLTDDKA